MKPIEEILDEVRRHKPGTPPPGMAERLGPRAFPGGWWHANEDDSAFDVMSGALGDFGLDVNFYLTQEYVSQLVAEHAPPEGDFADTSEDLARRRQIEACVAHINQKLVVQNSDLRFYAFEEDLPDWESNEPVILFLTMRERDVLVARGLVRPLAG